MNDNHEDLAQSIRMSHATTRHSIPAALTLVLLVLAGCASGPSPEAAAAPRRPLTASEKTTIAAAVAARMKDPDAAKFQWSPIVVRTRDGITDYCGLVNGKNLYGAYVGFDRFYAQLIFDHGALARVAVRSIANSGDDVSQMATDWSCTGFGY